jgi:hypothetical protein
VGTTVTFPSSYEGKRRKEREKKKEKKKKKKKKSLLTPLFTLVAW